MGVAAKELRWVVDISARTFALLGQVCGTSGDVIADACISSAHLAFHFIWRRVLAPAGQLPWSLVAGNIQENLEELADGEEPEEPVGKQLWKLMHRGHNLQELIAAVDVLGECCWSSLPAEQQHGSLAMLHKWHPDYSTHSLTSRSLLLHMSRILPAASK